MTETTVTTVPLHRLCPNPQQPRQTFDPEALLSLALTIHQNGLIQPIVVQADPDSNRYIIHDGERRWRASCALAYANASHPGDAARLKQIVYNFAETTKPLDLVELYHDLLYTEDIAVVIGDPASTKDLLVRALVANIQRADLNDIEQARAYQDLHDQGLSDNDIAQAVGKSRPSVANARRLLELPDPVQHQVASGTLSQRQGLALLPYYTLTPEVQRHISGHWFIGDALRNPHRHTADALRNKVNEALKYSGQRLGEDFPVDEPISGEHIIQATCAGCPLQASAGKQQVCFNEVCFAAKEAVYRKTRLQKLSEASGLPYLNPRNQAHGFFSSFSQWDENEVAACANAVESQCPRLHIGVKTGYRVLGPEGIEGSQYYCRHYDGEEKCRCLAALLAEQQAALKAHKKELRAIKDRAVLPVKALLSQADPDLLRIILWQMTNSWEGHRDKIPGYQPDALVAKLTAKLTRELNYFDHTQPADYKTQVDAWLAKMQLDGHGKSNRLAEIGRKLSRIDGYLARIISEIPAEEAIAGNIRNINDLIEELDTLIEDDDSDQAAREAAEELLGQAALALYALHEINQLMLSPAWRVDGFEHVEPLINAPLDGPPFAEHLHAASPSILRYVLAYLPELGDHGERRLTIAARFKELAAEKTPSVFA